MMEKTQLMRELQDVSDPEKVAQNLEKREIIFEALFRLFEKIGSTFDLETIIKLLLMTIVGQLGLRRVAFFLRRDRSSKLDLFHSIGLGRDVNFPPISLESDFLHWIDETEGVVLIDEFVNSHLAELEENQSIGEVLIKSGFSYACDLKEGDTLFGIMAFSHKVSGQGYSEFDRELLVMMSRVAAITIRNASLYQSVLKSRNELENFSRMKKEFIDHTSHELRTPLTTLRSSLWLIEPEGEEAMLIELARDSVLRLEQNVENILSLNKMDPNSAFIEPMATEFSSLVIAACGEIANELEEKNIFLDIRNAIGERYITVDPQRLKLVVKGLLNNAISSIECNGNIQVKLYEHSKKPCSDGITEIPAWDQEENDHQGNGITLNDPEKWIVVSITDDGRGIPAEEISTIGNPFVRASNSATGDIKGLGVGLSVAQKIIAAHGGHIYCSSVEGEGAEFSIWLPDG
jgi:signal transduction histidine kinase